jgi:hypothetical protein
VAIADPARGPAGRGARGLSRGRQPAGGDRGVARSSLVAARQAAGWVGRVALGTLLALIGYGVVRLLLGDPWSLATACLVGIALFFLARGSKAMRVAQAQSLDR